MFDINRWLNLIIIIIISNWAHTKQFLAQIFTNKFHYLAKIQGTVIGQSFTQTTYQKIKYEVFEESGAEKDVMGRN